MEDLKPVIVDLGLVAERRWMGGSSSPVSASVPRRGGAGEAALIPLLRQWDLSPLTHMYQRTSLSLFDIGLFPRIAAVCAQTPRILSKLVSRIETFVLVLPDSVPDISFMGAPETESQGTACEWQASFRLAHRLSYRLAFTSALIVRRHLREGWLRPAAVAP